ncbi:MAG: hypothetical protein ACNA7V_07735, partial [Bacteroidales bacterium]
MKNILFFACLILFICCVRQSEPATQVLFDHLEGAWQLSDLHVVEQWSMQADQLEGRVLLIRDSDTTLTEFLRIFEQNDTLFYEATVLDQNDGKPVRFKLSETTVNFW